MTEDQAVADKVLQDLAAEVLQKEQANPGSQDPEYVSWAKSKLNGAQIPSSPASVVPTPPQLATQPPATPTGTGDETVLQIQQTPGQTIQPTENNKPDNGQGQPSNPGSSS